MWNPLSFLVAMISFVCLAVGCSGSTDRPPLGQVSGTITVDGKPLPGAQVEFSPESGRMSFGTTDESGYYEMQYTNSVSGAVIGSHVVRISTSLGPPVGEGDDVQPAPELVPPEYNTKSTQKADVIEEANTFNFEIKTDGKVFKSISGGGA